MKKTRLFFSTAVAFVMACSVGMLAVGCDNNNSDPKTYTLTYEKGEDELGTAPEIKSYEAGATVTLAAADTFTKTDYTFTKWLDGTTEYDAGATFTMPERDVTLKAKWELDDPGEDPDDPGDPGDPDDPGDETDPTVLKLGANTYTLLEEEENDYNRLERTLTFTGGEPNTGYTVEIAYKASEYSFSVWTSVDSYDNYDDYLLGSGAYVAAVMTDGEGSFTLYLNGYNMDYNADDFTATITVTEGVNITYRVSFYEDERYANAPTSQTFEIPFGNSFASADEEFPADPEKEGYTFLGWFVYNWGFGDEFTEETVVTSDLKVVAKFVYSGDGKTELEESDNVLALGYDDVENGQICRTVTISGLKENTAYTVTYENINYSRIAVWNSQADYEADSWNALLDGIDTTAVVLVTDGGGTLSLYLNGATFNADGYSQSDYTITLTVEEGAHVTYEVLFYLDEMSGRPADGAYIAWGESFESAGEELPVLTKTGYTFLGWVDENGEPFTETTIVKSDMTVIGTWREDSAWTVTFYLSVDDIDSDNHLSVCYVSNGNRLATNDFPELTDNQIPSGKVFDGWYRVTYNESSGKWEYNVYTGELTASTYIYLDTVVIAVFEDAPEPEPENEQLSLNGLNTITFNDDDPAYSSGDKYRLVDFKGVAGEEYTFTVTSLSGNFCLFYAASWSPLVDVDAEETGTYTFTMPAEGVLKLKVYGNSISASGTISIALKGAESSSSVSLNTLSANEFNSSLASATVNQGETLTVTGNLQYNGTNSALDGIFVGVSDGQNYVMPSLSKWFYNSQDSEQAYNDSLNMNLVKGEVGFTETLSGGYVDNANALFLKKI